MAMIIDIIKITMITTISSCRRIVLHHRHLERHRREQEREREKPKNGLRHEVNLANIIIIIIIIFLFIKVEHILIYKLPTIINLVSPQNGVRYEVIFTSIIIKVHIKIILVLILFISMIFKVFIQRLSRILSCCYRLRKRRMGNTRLVSWSPRSLWEKLYNLTTTITAGQGRRIL